MTFKFNDKCVVYINSDDSWGIGRRYVALHRFDHLHNSLVRILLRADLRELEVEIVELILLRVEGFSLDYLVFNITGYTFYIIYSSVGYFTDIKGAGTVVIADLVFVYHAALMVVIETIQCIIYEVCC